MKAWEKEREIILSSEPVYQEDDNETIIDILVPESDMGAVIGHAGKNAKAIRTVIQAFATIHEVGRVKINIDSF